MTYATAAEAAPRTPKGTTFSGCNRLSVARNLTWEMGIVEGSFDDLGDV
jgi:hypothetical protein